MFEKNKVIIKLTHKKHPVFLAHFPNNPILPGFMLIDIIANILGDEIVNIKYAKFIGHIYPEDEIIYDIKTVDNQKTIIVQKNNIKTSEIKYESK